MISSNKIHHEKDVSLKELERRRKKAEKQSNKSLKRVLKKIKNMVST